MTVFAMANIEMKEKFIFEWRIEKFLAEIDHREHFCMNKCLFSLVADRRHFVNDRNRLCHFLLISDFKLLHTHQVSYRFSIVHKDGGIFITSMGKFLKNDIKQKRVIMTSDDDYLQEYNLVQRGTLIVRFTMDYKLDSRQISMSTEEEVLNAADAARNTNILVTKDNSTNTDEEPANFLENLSKDLSAYYESKRDTNCVLRVGDTQFAVHRAVLSARSSVFSAMFHYDTSENRSGEVNIIDVKETALANILYYIYSGKIRGLAPNTAVSMYTAADKYDLFNLSTECMKYLKQNLTMENICEAALLAHTQGETDLEELVACFIEENLDHVLESNTGQQFLKEKTLLGSKLLVSALKVSKKKQFRMQ